MARLTADDTPVELFGAEFVHRQRDDGWQWFALNIYSVSSDRGVCGIIGHITLFYIAGESAITTSDASERADLLVGQVLTSLQYDPVSWRTRLRLNRDCSRSHYAIFDLVVHDRAHASLCRIVDNLKHCFFGNALRPRREYHLSVQQCLEQV